MNYRKLCGNDVSILGFGAMRLPIMNDDSKKIDTTNAHKMLDYALEHGINYIDTAYPYHGGESEKFIGKYLEKRNMRKDIYLTTKLPSWSIKEESDMDTYFHEQQQRLKTDYFDYYLIHSLNATSWENLKKLGILEWCENKKKEGSIHHIGFSFHDQYPVFKKIVNDYKNWE